MGYASTGGERTVAELAARLYGLEERTAAARKASAALREANPELEEIENLPRGAVVEVPDIEGIEATRPVGELLDWAGGAAARSLRARFEELADTLDEVVEERVTRATDERKLLTSAGVKRAAREDRALATILKTASAETEAELEEARALRKEQRRALEAVAGDLEALLDVLKPPRRRQAEGRGWIHTVYREGAWLNEVEGGPELSRHRTKDEAVAAGREQAKRDGTEHVIHKRDGTIAERNSYTADAFPPRG